VAVRLDRAGTVAVAEHPAMLLGPQLALLAALVVTWELSGLVVEGLDLLGDG
jgi:hypothetical protein